MQRGNHPRRTRPAPPGRQSGNSEGQREGQGRGGGGQRMLGALPSHSSHPAAAPRSPALSCFLGHLLSALHVSAHHTCPWVTFPFRLIPRIRLSRVPRALLACVFLSLLPAEIDDPSPLKGKKDAIKPVPSAPPSTAFPKHFGPPSARALRGLQLICLCPSWP